MNILNLFRPDWASDDKDIRMKAVEKANSINKLVRIALRSEYVDAVTFAISKISEPLILTKIALRAKKFGTYAGNKAMEKIADQTLLHRIAKHAAESFVRHETVRRLQDQKVIASIAKNDKNWEVRRIAVRKMSGQGELLDIAINDKEYEVRSEAKLKLTGEYLILYNSIIGK